MKVDSISKIAIVFAIALLYSNAYAQQDFTTSTTVSIGAQLVKPSNHVTIRITSTTSAFAACSFHSSGDRHYATGYTDTKINYSTGAACPSINQTDVFTGAGWSSL